MGKAEQALWSRMTTTRRGAMLTEIREHFIQWGESEKSKKGRHRSSIQYFEELVYFLHSERPNESKEKVEGRALQGLHAAQRIKGISSEKYTIEWIHKYKEKRKRRCKKAAKQHKKDIKRVMAREAALDKAERRTVPQFRYWNPKRVGPPSDRALDPRFMPGPY